MLRSFPLAQGRRSAKVGLLAVFFLFVCVGVLNIVFEFDKEEMEFRSVGVGATLSRLFHGKLGYDVDDHQASIVSSDDILVSSPTTPSPTTIIATSNLEAKLHEIRKHLLQQGKQRLLDLENEHKSNNRSFAFGLRGISWLWKNYGVILGIPKLSLYVNKKENLFIHGDPKYPTLVQFDIENLNSEIPCDYVAMNAVSIWMRLAGPELIAQRAKPVFGKCEWTVTFNITVPGTYSALSKLLFYKDGQPVMKTCEYVPPGFVFETPEPSQIIHTVFEQFNFHDLKSDCCAVCSRFKGCKSWSVYETLKKDTKMKQGKALEFSAASLCELSSQPFEQRRRVNASLIPQRTISFSDGTNSTFEITSSGNTKPPFGVNATWYLGCGRNDPLLNWVPCGRSGAPTSLIGTQVEDVIVFEQTNRFEVYSNSENLFTTETALEALVDPSWLPVCDPIQITPQLNHETERTGRWVKLPASISCSNDSQIWNSGHPPFPNIYTWVDFMSMSNTDHPLCWFQHNYFKTSRWCGVSTCHGDEFGRLYRTELITKRDEILRYHYVPYICKPRVYSRSDIKTCLSSIGQDIGIKLDGASLKQLLNAAVNIRIGDALFDDKELLSRVSIHAGELRMLFNNSSEKQEMLKLYGSTIAMPHHMPDTYDEWRNAIRKYYPPQKSKEYQKFFFMPMGFSPMERNFYMDDGRNRIMRQIAREVLSQSPYPIYEIPYHMKTIAFAYDAATESDGLHYGGAPLKSCGDDVLDILCRDHLK